MVTVDYKVIRDSKLSPLAQGPFFKLTAFPAVLFQATISALVNAGVFSRLKLPEGKALITNIKQDISDLLTIMEYAETTEREIKDLLMSIIQIANIQVKTPEGEKILCEETLINTLESLSINRFTFYGTLGKIMQIVLLPQVLYKKEFLQLPENEKIKRTLRMQIVFASSLDTEVVYPFLIKASEAKDISLAKEAVNMLELKLVECSQKAERAIKEALLKVAKRDDLDQITRSMASGIATDRIYNFSNKTLEIVDDCE